ncbi:recQ-mediated genome instability protein 1 [Orussus abietinus]|uniref:recQ-mediated genome instability protein 1 n=1 Tax=Orussus abietinus TaxID=222816 RepID=UPI0006267CC3|nr:recQ-mediated genome instability protein 1 [Orussus abietinus]
MDRNIVSLTRRVKAALNSEFYMVNNAWLQDCVEYYVKEHGDNVPQKKIQEFVVSQWLLSDLREINNDNGCLPKNLSQQKHTVLSNKYILQVDKMYDISTSKYSQLQKIRNVSVENIEVTAEDKTQNWQPQKKRMLQLFLTDGIQDITAIEYKQIRFLKDMLLPGYKLMIIGPVTCRRGVLMLTEENIMDIGGEVEHLLIPNALENVLARALNLQENPDPYHTKEQQDSDGDMFEDDFDIDLDEVTRIEGSTSTSTTSRETTSTNTNQRNRNNSTANLREQNVPTKPSGNKNILDSRSYNSVPRIEGNNVKFPDDDLIEMVDQNQIGMTTSTSSTSVGSTYKTSCPQVSNFVLKNVANEFPDDDDDFIEMIDENQVKTSVYELNKPSTSKHNTLTSATDSPPTEFTKSRKINEDIDDEDELIRMIDENQISSTTNPGNTSTRSKGCTSSSNSKAALKPPSKVTAVPCDDIEIVQENLPPLNTAHYKQTTLQLESKKIPEKSSGVEFPDDDFDFDNIVLTAPPKYNSPAKEGRKKKDGTVRKEEEASFSTGAKRQLQLPNTSKRKLEDTFVAQKSPRLDKNNVHHSGTLSSVAGNKRPAMSPPMLQPHKERCVKETPKLSKITSKITDFTVKSSPGEAVPAKICDFICEILSKPPSDSVDLIKIRGKVTTLGKLTKKDSKWYLEGTITDGTASMDVIFADEVIGEILGFSVPEFASKKKLMKKQPDIEEQMRKSFRAAESKIRKMDTLLEVAIVRDAKPKIVKILDMTEEQKQAVDKRIKMLSM